MIAGQANREADFYDERYRSDYMHDWPESKKRRVVELVSATISRPHAAVLDFGCGRAPFAVALKNIRPSWRISGYDVSEVAIAENRRRHPELTFYGPSDPPHAPFDLVYTHHVLEHVRDLEGVVAQIASLVALKGHVIHVLPCGDPGSLESRLVALVRNGVEDPGSGRYYYEEPGHLRRLTSAQLIAVCARHRLTVRKRLFANQFWGGIEFLTEQQPQLLLRWLDPRRSKHRRGLVQLGLLAGALLPLAVGRLPARMVAAARRRRRRRTFYLILALALPAWPISFPVDRGLRWMRDREWRQRQGAGGGSEMYLIFERV